MKKVLFRFMNAENKNSFSMNSAIDYLKDVDPSLSELLNSFQIEELKPEKNYFKSFWGGGGMGGAAAVCGE